LKVPSEHLQIRLICSTARGLQSSIATELRNVFGAVVLPSYGMTLLMDDERDRVCTDVQPKLSPSPRSRVRS